MGGAFKIWVNNADKELERMVSFVDRYTPQVQSATSKALKRTLRAVQSEAMKIPNQVYTVRGFSLKKRAKILTGKSPTAVWLEIKERNGIGLINFSARPKRVLSWKGIAPKERRQVVSTKIKRSGARKVVSRHGNKPFVIQVKNGIHIFERDSNNKLERLYGPSLVNALFPRRRELELVAMDRFPDILREELQKVGYL